MPTTTTAGHGNNWVGILARDAFLRTRVTDSSTGQILLKGDNVSLIQTLKS